MNLERTDYLRLGAKHGAVAVFNAEDLAKYMILKSAKDYFLRTGKAPTFDNCAYYLSQAYRLPLPIAKRFLLSEKPLFETLCQELGVVQGCV